MLIIYHAATADYRKCKSKKTTLNLQKIDFVLSKSSDLEANTRSITKTWLIWAGQEVEASRPTEKQETND